MNITVGGIEAFNATLNRFDKEMLDLANKEVLTAALRTVGLAKQRLQPLPDDSPEETADIAAVRASINHEHDPENVTATVFAGNTGKDPIAAYLEFGTGEYAAKYVKTIPFEYEALAWQFFVNGKGTMKEHPFLIPTYLQEGKRFVERLKGLRPSRFN